MVFLKIVHHLTIRHTAMLEKRGVTHTNDVAKPSEMGTVKDVLDGNRGR